MGYSHYYKFRTNYKISSLKWKEIVDDFNKILDVEVDIPSNDLYRGTEGLTRLRSILEPDSDQRLEITDTEIRFNGREEGDRGHETFSIQRMSDERLKHYAKRLERDYIFDSCKTARKPYDIVVCCLLVILKYHLGNMIEVSSDGADWTNDDGVYYEIDGSWSDAIKLCAENLSYGIKFDGLRLHLFDECIKENEDKVFGVIGNDGRIGNSGVYLSL